MEESEWVELGKHNSNQAIWIEFSNGGEGLYFFYGFNQDGSADFYEVDLTTLEIGGTPYGFDRDYIKKIRVAIFP
jgi:hypothetical protein